MKAVKGSMPDMIESMILILILGIVLLVASYLKDQIYPEMRTLLGDEADAVIDVSESAFATFDYFFVFIAFGLGIAAVVMAYMGRFNPIFYFITLIVIAINLILAPIFSNVMLDFWTEAEFATYQSNYPMMLFIFRYYPHFINLFSTILSLVMFAKSRQASIGVA